VVSVAAFLLTTGSTPLEACGPFIEHAIFTFTKHPDFPLSRFAAGELGVLQPTYARSYLAVAYRYLSGAPLGADARQAADRLWQERLGPLWDERSGRAAEAWGRKRRGVPNVTASPAVDFFRPVPGSQFANYSNCLADAFQRAILTLDGLVSAHGASSPIIADWVRAQDVVFDNCANQERLPSPVVAAPAAGAQEHRTYQIAAAHFYAGKFTEAETMFRAIADDGSSPWRTLGRYLAARSLIRRATLLPAPGEVDRTLLARADAELQSITQDSALAGVHAAARSLRGFVRFRLEPRQRLNELADAISGRDAGAGFTQDLADYTLLLDKVVGDGPPASLAAVPSFAREHGITDWIVTFQTTDPAAIDHAVGRWDATKALPWLVVALAKVAHDDPRVPALDAAAREIAATSPAFVSLTYHRARLSIAGGRLDRARADLDRLLSARPESLGPSVRNLLMALRTRAASSFDEFLRLAQRAPAATTYGEDATERAIDLKESRLAKTPGVRVFDVDASSELNDRVPLARLAAGATTAALPANLRRRLATAAWTRAVVLGDTTRARSLAPILGELVPEMRAGLSEYASLADPNAQALAGMVLVLNHPGTRPFVDAGLDREAAMGRLDRYRNNWWCDDPVSDVTSPMTIVTAAELATARAERARLTKLGTAPNYLASEAVRLATLRPDDPKSPEALHLAVRTTRYGCTDARTGAASKRAFELLHKRYAGSEWARRTPYWYEG
jgi:hypothetical protein